MTLKASSPIALLILCLAGPVAAAKFAVVSLADTLDVVPGDGVCADESAACTLRAAIQEANASAGPDAIELGPGIHLLTRAGSLENLAASGDLDVTSEIDMAGASTAATSIDADSLDRVFDVRSGGLLRLRTLSVTGGWQALLNPPDMVERTGGGLLVRAGGGIELDDVRIHDNGSNRDGAGVSVFGSLSATRLRMHANLANPSFGVGGALYIGNTATLFELEECELTENRAGAGAGIYGDGTNPSITIRRCLIAGNDAGNDGGSIALNTGNAHWLLQNVTISGNQGGGIFGDGGHQLRCEHCTITANHSSSPNGGGAIADVRGPSSANFSAITLVNSIAAGNTQPSGNECHVVFSNVIVSAGGTLRAPGNACRMSAGPGDLIVASPGVEALLDNGGYTRTHALDVGSPAIDAAQAAHCATIDQRGMPRPIDGNGDGDARCDIGAYERAAGLFEDGFE